MKTTTYQSLLFLLARIFFAILFINAGIGKIMNFETYLVGMTNQGMIYEEVFLVLSILIEIGCGLLVLFGWKTRMAALLLVIFVIVVNGIYHDFWTYEGQDALRQLRAFMKNLTVIGGLLYMMGSGPGKISFDKK